MKKITKIYKLNYKIYSYEYVEKNLTVLDIKKISPTELKVTFTVPECDSACLNLKVFYQTNSKKGLKTGDCDTINFCQNEDLTDVIFQYNWNPPCSYENCKCPLCYQLDQDGNCFSPCLDNEIPDPYNQCKCVNKCDCENPCNSNEICNEGICEECIDGVVINNICYDICENCDINSCAPNQECIYYPPLNLCVCVPKCDCGEYNFETGQCCDSLNPNFNLITGKCEQCSEGYIYDCLLNECLPICDCNLNNCDIDVAYCNQVNNPDYPNTCVCYNCNKPCDNNEDCNGGLNILDCGCYNNDCVPCSNYECNSNEDCPIGCECLLGVCTTIVNCDCNNDNCELINDFCIHTETFGCICVDCEDISNDLQIIKNESFKGFELKYLGCGVNFNEHIFTTNISELKGNWYYNISGYYDSWYLFDTNVSQTTFTIPLNSNNELTYLGVWIKFESETFGFNCNFVKVGELELYEPFTCENNYPKSYEFKEFGIDGSPSTDYYQVNSILGINYDNYIWSTNLPGCSCLYFTNNPKEIYVISKKCSDISACNYNAECLPANLTVTGIIEKNNCEVNSEILLEDNCGCFNCTQLSFEPNCLLKINYSENNIFGVSYNLDTGGLFLSCEPDNTLNNTSNIPEYGSCDGTNCNWLLSDGLELLSYDGNTIIVKIINSEDSKLCFESKLYPGDCPICCCLEFPKCEIDCSKLDIQYEIDKNILKDIKIFYNNVEINNFEVTLTNSITNEIIILNSSELPLSYIDQNNNVQISGLPINTGSWAININYINFNNCVITDICNFELNINIVSEPIDCCTDIIYKGSKNLSFEVNLNVNGGVVESYIDIYNYKIADKFEIFDCNGNLIVSTPYIGTYSNIQDIIPSNGISYGVNAEKGFWSNQTNVGTLNSPYIYTNNPISGQQTIPNNYYYNNINYLDTSKLRIYYSLDTNICDKILIKTYSSSEDSLFNIFTYCPNKNCNCICHTPLEINCISEYCFEINPIILNNTCNIISDKIYVFQNNFETEINYGVICDTQGIKIIRKVKFDGLCQDLEYIFSLVYDNNTNKYVINHLTDINQNTINNDNLIIINDNCCEDINYQVSQICNNNNQIELIFNVDAETNIWYNNNGLNSLFINNTVFEPNQQLFFTLEKNGCKKLIQVTTNNCIDTNCNLDFEYKVICKEQESGSNISNLYILTLINSNIEITIDGLINSYSCIINPNDFQLSIINSVFQNYNSQYKFCQLDNSISNGSSYTIKITNDNCEKIISGVVNCPLIISNDCDDINFESYVDCSDNKIKIIIDNVFYNQNPTNYNVSGTHNIGDILNVDESYSITFTDISNNDCYFTVTGSNNCPVIDCLPLNASVNLVCQGNNSAIIEISINGVNYTNMNNIPNEYIITGDVIGDIILYNDTYSTKIQYLNVNNTLCEIILTGVNNCQVPCDLSLQINNNNIIVAENTCNVAQLGHINCILNNAIDALPNSNQTININYWYSNLTLGLNGVTITEFKTNIVLAFNFLKNILENIYAGLTVNFIEIPNQGSGGNGIEINIENNAPNSSNGLCNPAIARGGNYSNCQSGKLTFYKQNGCNLQDYIWRANSDPVGIFVYSVAYTALHELLHWVGLNHFGNPALDEEYILDNYASFESLNGDSIPSNELTYITDCLYSYYGYGNNTQYSSNENNINITINGSNIAPYNYTISANSPNVVFTTSTSGISNTNNIPVSWNLLQNGNYIITITVTDNAGCTETITYNINNINEDCELDFNGNINNCTNLNVNITNGVLPYTISIVDNNNNNITNTTLNSNNFNYNLPNNISYITINITDSQSCNIQKTIYTNCGDNIKICGLPFELNLNNNETYVFNHNSINGGQIQFLFNNPTCVNINIPATTECAAINETLCFGTGSGFTTYQQTPFGFVPIYSNGFVGANNPYPNDWSLQQISTSFSKSGRIQFNPCFDQNSQDITFTIISNNNNTTVQSYISCPLCNYLSYPEERVDISAYFNCDNNNISIQANITGENPFNYGFNLYVINILNPNNPIIVWQGQGYNINVNLPVSLYMIQAVDENGCLHNNILYCDIINCSDNSLDFADPALYTFGSTKTYYVDLGTTNGTVIIDGNTKYIADRIRVFYPADSNNLVADSNFIGKFPDPTNFLPFGQACNYPPNCNCVNDFYIGYVEINNLNNPLPLCGNPPLPIPDDHCYKDTTFGEQGLFRLFYDYTYNNISSLVRIEIDSNSNAFTILDLCIKCPTIISPPCPNIILNAIYNCNDGLIFNVTNGLAPYTFKDQNNINYIGGEILPNGTYVFTVTDADGCTGTTTTIVNNAPSVTIDNDFKINSITINCTNATNDTTMTIDAISGKYSNCVCCNIEYSEQNTLEIFVNNIATVAPIVLPPQIATCGAQMGTIHNIPSIAFKPCDYVIGDIVKIKITRTISDITNNCGQSLAGVYILEKEHILTASDLNCCPANQCSLNVDNYTISCQNNYPVISVNLSFINPPTTGQLTILKSVNGIAAGGFTYNPSQSTATNNIVVNSSFLTNYGSSPWNISYCFSNNSNCCTNLIINQNEIPTCNCNSIIAVERDLIVVIPDCPNFGYDLQITVLYTNVAIGTNITLEWNIGSSNGVYTYNSSQLNNELITLTNLPFSSNFDVIIKSYVTSEPNCFTSTNLFRITYADEC